MTSIELSTTLHPDATSAAAARRFVRSALADWGQSRLEDVASLLVSELVTNAIVHTRSGPEVMVRLGDGRLRVEVADESSHPPVRQRLSQHPEAGRGMILVGELATSWGTEPADSGKVVWFELEAARPTRRAQSDHRRLAPADSATR